MMGGNVSRSSSGGTRAGIKSRFVDLDGPLLLAEDRAHGVRFEGSEMHPPGRELWG